MFHCGQEAYFSGHLFYIHAPSCTIISTLHALNTWMLLSPDSLVSIFPCLGAVWIDLLHVNLIWKDSGMEQRKARTLSFTCQLLKHIRDSWSLNRMIRSFVYFDVYLSATIYDSGYVHISQHPRSSDVFQSCLTLAFIIYVGWWILQDSSKPRFKGSCPSMRSFCHGRTLSDGYICNGMGVSENGACMGMPVYRKKKKHVGKMDDPWWSIKFWDARFSDPNLECWAIQQNFAGDSKSQSCARCIEFGHRRVQGSKWKDRPCDTRMFVISDKDACLQVVNKFDIWTNCEKNWCSDSDADCCSRWGRCGAVSEPPCGWWQIRLGTHCLSRTSELSSHCWGVVNALNTDHFRSVASVFDILLISRIWFAPHLKLLPDVNLLKIKRIRSQIVWTVDCRLHIQIRAGLSPASIYRPYSPLSILVPLWSEPHFGRPFGASLGATLKQYF
jgi:hypothetical protein